MADYQHKINQIGEVTYREKASFGEPEKVFILCEERNKARKTVFDSLRARGVDFSYFLEIGAERGQTALLVANEYGAEGMAIDISLHSLQTANKLRAHFHFKKDVLKICCDAGRLPFNDGAFSFVYCFQTLHHFDNIEPVLKEISRVLGNHGHFFFSEEPVRRLLCLNLYRTRRPEEFNWVERFLQRTGLIFFIAEAYLGSREEVSYKIIENQSISVKSWEHILNDIFNDVDLNYDGLFREGKYLESILSRYFNKRRVQRTMANLFGCSLQGLCKVKKDVDSDKKGAFIKCIRCPDCMMPLQQEKGAFHCINCGTFKNRDGVHILLPKERAKILYP